MDSMRAHDPAGAAALERIKRAGFQIVDPAERIVQRALDYSAWGSQPWSRGRYMHHGSIWAIEITGEVFAELLYPQLRAHLLARPPRHRDIENADVEREDEEPAELLVDAVTASKLDRERLPAIDTEAIQVRYADGHLRLFVDQRALDPDADKRTNALAAIYAVLLDDVYGALAEEVSVEIAAFTSYDEYGEGALASAKILWRKTLDREGLARMIADVSAAGATR